MQSAKANQGVHPHPNVVDRNKAIIWARYLIDSSDWLIFACKVNYLPSTIQTTNKPVTKTGLAQPKLVSLALITPEGKVVFESMLKSDDVVPSELLAEQGLSQPVVFNARPFCEIALQLARMTDGKQVLTWDLAEVQVLFDELCVEYAQPPLVFAGHSLKDEYARFTGEVDEGGRNYKLQQLKPANNSAVAQCRAVLDVLYQMASSSQTNNNAVTGNQGWTGEFYKPKLTARDKFKGFLGL